MGHRAPKEYAPAPGQGGMLTRAEYASRLFINGKINLPEFEKRIRYLMETGKEDDPYIVDAGPGGFKYS